MRSTCVFCAHQRRFAHRGHRGFLRNTACPALRAGHAVFRRLSSHRGAHWRMGERPRALPAKMLSSATGVACPARARHAFFRRLSSHRGAASAHGGATQSISREDAVIRDGGHMLSSAQEHAKSAHHETHVAGTIGISARTIEPTVTRVNRAGRRSAQSGP